SRSCRSASPSCCRGPPSRSTSSCPTSGATSCTAFTSRARSSARSTPPTAPGCTRGWTARSRPSWTAPSPSEQRSGAGWRSDRRVLTAAAVDGATMSDVPSPEVAQPDDVLPLGELEDVDEVLDAVVARMGGARRDGQHEMARAVASALQHGERLMVQAGTGTGKSLAYLVPTLLHTVRSGERAVVSTATLALQRQVIGHDLPLVADVVADRLPREPSVALLKGWHNYVCKHKIAGGYPAEEDAALFDVAAAAPSAA